MERHGADHQATRLRAQKTWDGSDPGRLWFRRPPVLLCPGIGERRKAMEAAMRAPKWESLAARALES
jgi:hypothetical protein